jgi:DNA-directed RNA polymerase alpha subunit
LTDAGIRTVGGLARKREADLLELDGMGPKAVTEIKTALSARGVTLKD